VDGINNCEIVLSLGERNAYATQSANASRNNQLWALG